MTAASGGSYGPYDFPSAQLNNYAAAFARAVTARAMFRRAEGELNQAVAEFERRYQNSAEMRQAIADERAAYEALNRARRKALQPIVNDEKYMRLTALYQDLAERLQQGRVTRSIAADEVIAMAQIKLKYASDLHAMEADTLNGDGSVREAQDRLVAAGSRVAALRQRQDDARRADPDLLAARRNVEDARIAQLAADAYLTGQAIAAGEGLDGYYWARTPYRGYYPNTIYGGYGSYAGY
jgi:phospholipase/lecithinase/hemolysin